MKTGGIARTQSMPGQTDRFRALAGLAVGVIVAATSPAWAIKPLAQVEDGYPEAPGQVEYENTFTISHKIPGDSRYTQYANEHEIEYGASENLTLRGKGAWYYEHTGDGSGTHFDSAGVEAQYFFTDPNTDAVGISVIGSALFGEKTFSSENFFVVQKDFDRWIVGYNLGLIVDVDGFGHGEQTTTPTIRNAAGALYELANEAPIGTLRIGGDIATETSWTDFFRHKDQTTLYVGPVINWIPTDKLWITVGTEFEVLRESSDAPYFQLTLIVGYYF